MDLISSNENKTIKLISKLNKDSKHRKKEEMFIVEGFRLCDDAIKSNCIIKYFLYSESAYSNNKEKIDSYISLAELSFCCTDTIFSGISDTKTPQGVLFAVKTLDKNCDVDKISNDNGVVLALDTIQDPTNLGTILRSAEAFGVSNVIMSNTSCDVFSPKVVRGSMGAIFRLNICTTNDLASFVKNYSKDHDSYATVLSETATKLSETKFTKPSLVVIGNEGNGISDSVINSCTKKVFIDMAGNAESLNASVAASIILWEMTK